MENKIILESGKVLERFEDYFFSSEIHENECSISFQAREICGWDENGNYLFKIDDDDGVMFVPWSDKAELDLSGFIKSDGCSNWTFHENDTMVHFCGAKDAMALFRLIEHLYETARRTIPRAIDEDHLWR